jgi:hypothetical protein
MRQSCENPAPLLQSRIGIGFSDHGLRAWLVHAGVEFKFTRAHGILPRPGHGPAGDYVGKTRDVSLGVDRSHPERMQLQNLTGEVFVESALLP